MRSNIYLTLFLIIGISINGFGQKNKIPKKIRTDIPELAKYLTEGTNTEEQKLDAIYSYVTGTIEYDVKILEQTKCSRFEGPKEVLKSGKTTCMGYVYLLGALLSEVNIKWELVSGYTNVPQPYYTAQYLIDDHAWIAIRVGGVWKLADPTWDAGYVGPLTKKDKRPSFEKQQLNIDKIIAKNQKRAAKGKELIEIPPLDTAKKTFYGKKIGFVRNETREWYLLPADSFMLRHLPSNPMWQLRTPQMPLSAFSGGSDSIKAYTTANEDQGFNNDEVDQFHEQPLLDKILAEGNAAHNFNPKNTRTKAVHYHSFLEILNIPEVRKNFKDLPDKITQAMKQKMVQVGDTAIKMTKMAETAERGRHKEVTTACGKGFKNANSANKKFLTSTEKVIKWNQKFLDNLEKADFKIQADLGKLNTPATLKTIDTTGLDFHAIKTIHRQIKQLTDSIDKMERNWNKAVNDSSLISALTTTQFSEYILQQRSLILQQKNLHNYQYVEIADSYLTENIAKMDKLYKDSLDAEIYPSAINKVALQLGKMDKQIDAALKEAIAQGKISASEQYKDYYDNLIIRYQQAAKANTELALQHHRWLKTNLESFDYYWDTMAAESKSQIKLTEQTNEIVIDEEERAHQREEDLLKVIGEESKNWKDKAKGKTS